MRPTHIFIWPLILLVLVVLSCSEKREVKSVYGLLNDTIVSIKTYDEQSRLIFDRTTQIVEDWNNGLLTWMTAKQFQGNKQTFEYYAHSNLGLRITIFDYNHDGDLKDKYSKYFSSSNREAQNPFAEIYQIKSRDSLISYLQQNISDSIPFTKHNASIENTQLFKTYADTANLQVKEYWTIEASNLIQRKVEKYDSKGRLVYQYNQTRWNEGYKYFKYDSYGNLIEELDIWRPEDNRFQKKEHLYKNGRLQKTLFFHDTSLAFTYEYFYEDTLLTKEVKTRLTEAEHFKNRKKTETIKYRYDYFE